MAGQYRVRIFGKQSCDKCAVLNQRVDKLLQQAEWADFEKQYLDVETEEGLVAFAQTECINPQRIPAMLVERRNPGTGLFEPLPNRAPGRPDPVYRKCKLYQYLGVQTDYSDTGRGVLSPQVIRTCLEEARDN